jgi:hypothetical protein
MTNGKKRRIGSPGWVFLSSSFAPLCGKGKSAALSIPSALLALLGTMRPMPISFQIRKRWRRFAPCWKRQQARRYRRFLRSKKRWCPGGNSARVYPAANHTSARHRCLVGTGNPGVRRLKRRVRHLKREKLRLLLPRLEVRLPQAWPRLSQRHQSPAASGYPRSPQ